MARVVFNVLSCSLDLDEPGLGIRLHVIQLCRSNHPVPEGIDARLLEVGFGTHQRIDDRRRQVDIEQLYQLSRRQVFRNQGA